MELDNQKSVEVFLFASSEGNFLGGTLLSIKRSAEHAKANGLKVKLSVILYRATSLTAAMIDHYTDKSWQKLELGDVGLSEARNAAGLALDAPFAAFIDGYDVWCENWLYAGINAARKLRAVWRPRWLLTFGNDLGLVSGYSAMQQPSELCNSADLLTSDPYQSGFVSAREIIKSCKWPTPDVDRGWVGVDRWWNCEVAGRGYEHRTLKSTFHYRRRPLALSKASKVCEVSVSRCGPTNLAEIQNVALAGSASRTGFHSGDQGLG